MMHLLILNLYKYIVVLYSNLVNIKSSKCSGGRVMDYDMGEGTNKNHRNNPCKQKYALRLFDFS